MFINNQGIITKIAVMPIYSKKTTFKNLLLNRLIFKEQSLQEMGNGLKIQESENIWTTGVGLHPPRGNTHCI